MSNMRLVTWLISSCRGSSYARRAPMRAEEEQRDPKEWVTEIGGLTVWMSLHYSLDRGHRPCRIVSM